MKQIVIVLFLFIAVAFSANAQYNQSINQPDNNQSNDQSPQRKFYFGIGGGFGLGTGYNYYSVLPVVGYRVTDNFSLGASFTYQRYNYTGTYGYSFTQYGAGPYLRYNFNSFFAQTEYDIINSPSYDANNEIIHANYSRWLLGIGYNFTQGSRSSLVGVVMYDVLYRVPSVFNSPIVTRVYFTF